MKALNLIRFFTLSIGVLGLTMVYSSAVGQEYDDMYFNKSDRKTVKAEKVVAVTNQNATTSNIENKNITKTTQEYSSKNINPEYIARYKSTEANQVTEPALKENDGYSSKDYFVENYDNSQYVSDPNKNEINYAALNKRDQMSTSNYSNYNRPYSSPSWRFSPYMAMGMGYGYPAFGGYGYNPYMMGYDPYMMGYGSGMSMGFGFGSGFGFGPTMSYSLGMSYGTGYNPWGGWGRYPGYSPYGMGGFYDPWGPSFGYNPYRYNYASYYGGGCPMGIYNSAMYGGSRYGGAVVSTSANRSEYVNGRNVSYKSRATRSAATTPKYTRTSTASERVRVSSNTDRVRIPGRSDVSTTASAPNGRTSSRDFSASQNEKVQRYYNTTRRNSSSNSTQRISTSSASRNTYRRNSGTTSTSRFNSSSYSNKPTRRSTGYSSGYNRSTNTRSSSFTGRSSSGSSSYSPSRSSSGSSFGRSTSGGGSRSYSPSSSGGGRSSGASYSGGSRSSGGRSGGRQ